MTITYAGLPDRRRRGARFWVRPENLWAARRKLRVDHSVAWRQSYPSATLLAPTSAVGPVNPARSVPMSRLVDQPVDGGVRFLILGDTGEGDVSQYATLPVIRALAPDFMVINGDVAYPAGREQDFLNGFFEPYRGLGIPIWAVPGNHEYYSSGKGKEFYHFFCDQDAASVWERHGLRFVPQPGTFWELRDDKLRLSVLALDTGMKGNLDGDSPEEEDREQHAWLLERLHQAQEEQVKVILLFHIPALAARTHLGRRTQPGRWQRLKERATGKSTPALATLHRFVAAFPCVRLVVAGHDHNYQGYAPGTFATYLHQEYGALPAAAAPHYVVCGGGGAYPQTTAFKGGAYGCDLFPDDRQWREYAGRWMGRKSALVSKVAAELADADDGRFLSLLLVECQAGDPPTTTVTPVWVEDLRTVLFDPALPGGVHRVVDLTSPSTKVPATMLPRCLKAEARVVL